MNKLFALLPALLAAAVSAQGVDAGAERARIQSERDQAEQRFRQEQRACNGKFNVTDCLNEAKAKRREKLSDLRRQEVALNDQERKHKAAERLKEIEERRSNDHQEQAARQRAKAQSDQQARDDRAAGKAAKKPGPEGARQQRAAEQQIRIREHAGDQAEAARKREQEAQENRAEREKRLKDAEERKAKAEKRMAERKKPAASDLPPPKP